MPSLSFPTVNPCCYFPCQHKGICVQVGTEGYECDCTRTGYFGTNCTSREYLPCPFHNSWGRGGRERQRGGIYAEAETCRTFSDNSSLPAPTGSVPPRNLHVSVTLEHLKVSNLVSGLDSVGDCSRVPPS